MSSVRTRASAFLLSLACLASAASAGTSIEKTFRAAAKAAQKAVRAEVKASLATAKASLTDAFVTFEDDEEIIPALESATGAVAIAAAANATAARTAATTLSADGATLLLDFAGQVPADFLDGGRGTWDQFKTRTETTLAKADAQLAKRYSRFVRAVTKLALKSGYDPDVRYEVRGHDDLLRDVVGPVLTGGGPPLAALTQRAQIVVDARFLTVDDDLITTIGVDFRGVGDAVLDVTDADGNTASISGLDADGFGTLRATLQLTSGVAGPVTTVLTDGDESELDVVRGSAPTRAEASKDLLKDFRASLKQEFSFGKKQLAQDSKALAQSLAQVKKARAAGDQTTAEAVQAGIAAYRQQLGTDCFWMDEVRQNPVDGVSQAISDAAGGDVDVPARFMPDGAGEDTRFIAALDKAISKAVTKRGRLFDSFLKAVGKQAEKDGETFASSLVLQPYRRLPAPVIDVNAGVTAIKSDPQTLVGAVVRIEGEGTDILGLFAGIAKDGLLSSTDSYLEESQGDLFAPENVVEVSGAFKSTFPSLADVPVLGWLFHTTNNLRERDDVIVLVTPTVIQAVEM
ncbi:MAG: hypothetical protein H6825_12770 [Planctomycetes bacterium]|nr:hypothetical protein [Planctomycetota bacterium]